ELPSGILGFGFSPRVAAHLNPRAIADVFRELSRPIGPFCTVRAKAPRSWHLFRCYRHFSERHSWFQCFAVFAGVAHCWRDGKAAPRWRACVGLGWPTGCPHGPAPPLSLYITLAKNLYEQKTRGELGVLSFCDLLQH